MIHVLRHLVGLKRPYNSVEECSVIPYLMQEIDHPTFVDGAGNLHCDMRGAAGPGQSRTLFVAHVDTVHWRGGKNNYMQDKAGNLYADGDCLGADDAAGVAILCEMIARGVAGYYIFTRGEEQGCIGSGHLVDYWSDLLAEFDRAIAFDRRGTTDVISSQRGKPRCSTRFAEALTDALNDLGMLMMPASGVYTDTAEYVGLIPECTNISVGYYHEHTDEEWLDMAHWRALRAAVLTLDWEGLPTCSKRAAALVEDTSSAPPSLNAGKSGAKAATRSFWFTDQEGSDSLLTDPFVDDEFPHQ